MTTKKYWFRFFVNFLEHLDFKATIKSFVQKLWPNMLTKKHISASNSNFQILILFNMIFWYLKP